MDFVQNLSYLQIIWTVLMTLASLQCLQVLSGSVNDVNKWNEQPKDTIGWFEFRKRAAANGLLMLVVTLWLTWNVIGAYCFGREPGQLFQQAVELVLSPRKNTTSATSVAIALLFYIINALHNLHVSVNISIYSRRQTLHVFEAVVTYFTILLMPFIVISEGPGFTLQEGCLSMSSISLLQIVGMVLIFVGIYIVNVTSKALAKLRRNRFGHITTTDYKQPKGGFFDLVGCPLYFADILMTLGFGIILNFTFTWCLWIVTLFLFLIAPASATKQFYIKKFEDYPKNKKMIIPYVF